MKGKIEARLDVLRKNKEQAIGQLNAINGAIQILEDILKEDEGDKKEEVK